MDRKSKSVSLVVDVRARLTEMLQMARRQPELWDPTLRASVKTLAVEMDHGQEPGLPLDLTSDEEWLELPEIARSLGMTVPSFKHLMEDYPRLKDYRRLAPARGRGKPPYQYHQPSIEMWYRNRPDEAELSQGLGSRPPQERPADADAA